VSPIVSLGMSAPQPATSEDEGEITSQHPPHRTRSADSTPPAQSAAEPALAPARTDAINALFEEPLAAQPVASMAAPAATRASLQQTLGYQAPLPLGEPPLEVQAEPVTPASVVAPPEPTVRYPAAAADPTASQLQAARLAPSAQHLAATQVYEPVQPEAAFVDEAVPVMEATIAASEQAAQSVAPQGSARQAARASIEQSQEEGVYILRLLKNGEAAAFGTFEALVVLVDSDAELFTGA
jgi:hypothetical protein